MVPVISKSISITTLIMFSTQRYSDIVKAEEEQKHGRVADSNVDML